LPCAINSKHERVIDTVSWLTSYSYYASVAFTSAKGLATLSLRYNNIPEYTMEGRKVKEFPAVDNKLQAPTKKSVFEKQKAEQEAKRLREEAETAAVYEDFVKSFDDEDVPRNTGGFGYGGSGFSAGFGGVSGPPKRHFSSGMPAAPSGARGGFTQGRGRGLSGPGSLGLPPGLARNRAYDGFDPQPPRKGNDKGRLNFEDYESGSTVPAKAFNTSDDEDERQIGGRSAEPAVPKPTLRLASLPPGTSPAFIKSLLPSNLKVDAVRIIPTPSSGAAQERKSMSAIVTLSKETAANDIDAAVNALQNRYLGYGFYLSLNRHLSSAALSSAPIAGITAGIPTSQPFGAKPVNIEAPIGHAHAPPGHRGFAPPTSYAPTGPGYLPKTGPLLHVPVQPPRDIKELKLIHKTIESLLTHGPEFEALLMTRPEVQKEEKWAWLWDPRSTGGVWYRWRLWEVLTGSQNKKNRGKYLPLFENSSAWKAPDTPLAFEYTTRLDEFVSDSEYNSSDEDDSGDEGAPRRQQGGPPDASGLNDDGTTYLNPLEKAKLTHLLARLPTSTGKLRKGDVARVTAFAISHAGRGADEVVAAIISNIENPFAYTSANPDRKKDKESSSADATPAVPNEDEEKEDTSSASLIGLYIVSDILSSSSTSGVRHAWRYRQLFEAALRQRRVLETLGRLEKKMSWGKLRAEKWKRSVGNVLSLWEGWCVFPQESQEHFVSVFNNPPISKEEEEQEKERVKAQEAKEKSRWKTVEKKEDAADTPRDEEIVDEDVDGEQMEEDEDVDGVPMISDEDMDGELMAEDDEDIDGEPMDEDAYEPPPAETTEEKQMDENPEKVGLGAISSGTGSPRNARKRPKAEDMFADSGSEGE
jgi:U2-associated protein SR140